MTILFVITGLLLLVSFIADKERTLNGLKKGAIQFLRLLPTLLTVIALFSAAKIPMLTFEIAFPGLKFSLLRLLLTIPVFIIIAIIMEKQLRNKPYEITRPE